MSSDDETLHRPLPEAVRQHVVDLGAQVLGTLALADVPPQLRAIARFDPRKRARLAGTSIAAQLESDKDFREHVGQALSDAWPDLVAGLREGAVPPAAEPVLIAAAAYLIRPVGWHDMIEVAREDIERSTAAAEGAAAEETAAKLRAQLTAAKVSGKEEADRLREQLKTVRAENTDLRRKLHETRERLKAAEEETNTLADAMAALRAETALAAGAGDAELKRLRERLAAAENQLEAGKRAAREGRTAEDARLRILLDALQDAAAGLRRELALPSVISKPADTVSAVTPGPQGARRLPARALADDDPALLDQILILPQLHIIVDGYNVTKTGYGTLTLAEQRARLVGGLSALAAQTRAEVTCVFDGAELNAPVPVSSPRGVRVRFSAPGQTADDLIRQLVRAEPTGRAVAVISSDREVAESVARLGARPVLSALLLRRLGRA
ncbi:NYN domain-containing protein [Rhizohabitans arisaemae]|uniref:NYN domain-containing protein n=1 Tax=Rhizohabitans arisaemae TaxID=2720610 RepID=UPI0024B14CFF|nr:NYN domain-containing protein [Rhizohabitans arisaemae]